VDFQDRVSDKELNRNVRPCRALKKRAEFQPPPFIRSPALAGLRKPS
jgi:hypothetical protein